MKIQNWLGENLKNRNDVQIDFVVPYVNSNDKAWQEERKKYLISSDDLEDTENNGDCRYRDWGTLIYWFRGVARFAPWVHRVYLLLDRTTTVPDFLNPQADKLRIVYHDEFIPKEYLPVYSSAAFEMFLHKIPDLSEHFVYFNDDMFLLQPVKKKDFFKKGLPCYHFIQTSFRPYGWGSYERQCYNNIVIINRHFDQKIQRKAHPLKYLTIRRNMKDNILHYATSLTKKYSRIYINHRPNPLRKSTFETIWELEEERLRNVASHRFRTLDDLNQYLFLEWDMVSGNFYNRRFGDISCKVSNESISYCTGVITHQKAKSLCINDSEKVQDEDFEKLCAMIKLAFHKILPDCCEYEKDTGDVKTPGTCKTVFFLVPTVFDNRDV